MSTHQTAGPEVARVFNEAMADYARVMTGQTDLVAALCEDVTANWLAGASGLLSAVDDLRSDLPDLPPEALHGRLDAFLEKVSSGLTAQMAVVQKQDAVRQMLGSLAEMAGALAQLDLARLSSSAEAAAAPRDILGRIAAGYVTVSQRQVLDAALTFQRQEKDTSPEIELF